VSDDYDWVEKLIQDRHEHQKAVFKRLLKDFPKSKEEMAQQGWDHYMKENKPETMQEAVENMSKAFKDLGISIADVAEKDLKALKRAFETEELRLLIQAATQRMKDDHDRMMKKAQRQIAWLLFLVGCAIAYEIWAIPALEKWMGIR
jgi:16S rRNA U516 pseudouridylate synthase RsuA-like enzyme